MSEKHVIQNAERQAYVTAAIRAYNLVRKGADAASVMNQILSLAGIKGTFRDPSEVSKEISAGESRK